MKTLLTTLFLALVTLPANAGSLLQPPADALRVEFTSTDTSPADRLKAGQPLTMGVVVSRSTGAVEVMPTSTPEWMTYDAANRQFSGVPVPGEHELSVRVTDTGTGQTATGVLSFNVEAR
ncbi:putative Ig domain-containing protein [Rhizobium sp. GR12]|uniref:putative Ig domain-containing protein n=1 Tax=Rhizobium sp. GR12 TaxID=3053925 RepID=UPI002FBD53B3